MANAADIAADYQERDLAIALSRRKPRHAVQHVRCHVCRGRNDRPECRTCSDCVSLSAAQRDAVRREVGL